MHRLELQREHTRSPPAAAMLQAQRMPSNASYRSNSSRYGPGRGAAGGGASSSASDRPGSSSQHHTNGIGGLQQQQPSYSSSNNHNNAGHSHTPSQAYSQSGHSHTHSQAYSTSYGGSTYAGGRQNSLTSNTSRTGHVHSSYSQTSHPPYSPVPPQSPGAAPGTSPPNNNGNNTTFASAQRPPSALFAASPPSSPPPFRHNDDRLRPRPLKGANLSPQSPQQGFGQFPPQTQDTALAVTICGDGGCGKSSLTLRVVRGAWTSEYDPTIEDSYSVTRRVDGQTFSLHITDTAGQEEYRELFTAGSSRALKADAFLLVYSIASVESLRLLDVWAAIVDKECEERKRKGGVWPGVMVVGNKCDLSAEREVSAAEGLEWARKRGYGFMETSARECVNIEETFSALVRRVLEARRLFASGHTQPPAAAPAVPLTTQGLQGSPVPPVSNKWAPQQPKSMTDSKLVNRKTSQRTKEYGDEKADPDEITIANKQRDTSKSPNPGARPKDRGINAPKRTTKVPPRPVGYQDTGFQSRLKVALSFQWCV